MQQQNSCCTATIPSILFLTLFQDPKTEKQKQAGLQIYKPKYWSGLLNQITSKELDRAHIVHQLLTGVLLMARAFTIG